MRTKKEGYTLTILNKKGRQVRGLAAILSAVNRKQLPLCKMHHDEFDQGKYSDIDTEYLSRAMNIHSPETATLKEIYQEGSASIQPKKR